MELLELKLTTTERDILRHALEVYVSDLREEIVKTEKHRWRVALHQERDVLQHILRRLGVPEPVAAFNTDDTH